MLKSLLAPYYAFARWRQRRYFGQARMRERSNREFVKAVLQVQSVEDLAKFHASKAFYNG